jgi:site-specific DNA-methyltransferase (adenine-specific)
MKKKNYKIFNGDNMVGLKKLKDNSVDSIVTDPPYGLSFMNKKWDYDVPTVELWKEVYRVLKPGGHILSFGGTRTYHRMVVNIEDAGFEIRDQIMWLYGSGFPKSHNIEKNIKKIDPDNNDFNGFGTSLKPANEPICLARKPLSEKTIVKNVLEWGTGGINIDECRVGSDGGKSQMVETKHSSINKKPTGRFPANVILECLCENVIEGEHIHRTYNDTGNTHTDSNCPCYILDQQTGILKGDSPNRKPRKGGHRKQYVGTENNNIQKVVVEPKAFSDKGGASRFFYNAKVSKKERNIGLEEGTTSTHPTVKPVKLMRYLCRLITPPGGVVLDPFMGSGSTGISALKEGFRFIGMDMDEEYCKIAEQRIKNHEKY